MWSFLLGSAVAVFALNNGPLLRRAVAWIVVKSEKGAEAASKHVIRTGAKVLEDAQDIVAEAAAQREADRMRSEAQSPSQGQNLNIN